MLIHSTQIQGTQRNPKSWALDDFALVIRRSFVIMYEVSRWQEFLHRTTNKSNKGRRSTDGFLGGGQRGGDRKNVITANVSMQLPQDFVCGWSDVRFFVSFQRQIFWPEFGLVLPGELHVLKALNAIPFGSPKSLGGVKRHAKLTALLFYNYISEMKKRLNPNENFCHTMLTPSRKHFMEYIFCPFNCFTQFQEIVEAGQKTFLKS